MSTSVRSDAAVTAGKVPSLSFLCVCSECLLDWLQTCVGPSGPVLDRLRPLYMFLQERCHSCGVPQGSALGLLLNLCAFPFAGVINQHNIPLHQYDLFLMILHLHLMPSETAQRAHNCGRLWTLHMFSVMMRREHLFSAVSDILSHFWQWETCSWICYVYII